MAEKENICRSITFCSNYIPASTTEKNWQYVSIGTIDGIIVSDNLIKKPEDSIAECIWEEQKKFQQESRGEFSAQQIFIISNDDAVAEQNFWNMEEEYFFYFFCFCQISGDKNALWDNKESFEKTLADQNDLRIKTYLTYDNTDLFIVLKTKNYNTGAVIINKLHHNIGWEPEAQISMKNSYTVFAMSRQCLNDTTIPKMLYEQKLNYVLISIMEKKKEDLKKAEETISNILGEEIQFTPILGENDDVAILKNISWGDFAKLYGEMLVKRNNFYSTGVVASISTLLITEIEQGEKCLNNNGIIANENSGSTQEEEKSRGKYLAKIDDLEQKCEINQDGYHRELKIILNALPKFTGEVFNDYIFYSLLKPIEVLLDLIYINGRFSKYNKEYYYEFINYLYIYIQTSNMSDKHTVQGLGFNSKIYDVPIKISAFYNAFLHEMTEILNVGNTCEYVFLTVPGMQFNVNVNELYPNVSDEKRLILIKIPESSFYNLRDMMNILGHETAHYVGREFRNRRERLFSFVKSYVHIFTRYLRFMYLANFNEDCLKEENLLDEIEKRIEDLVIWGLEERRLFINRENQGDKKIPIDYFAVLIPNIAHVMEKLIENDFELALSPIGDNIKDKDEARQLISNLREIAERFMHKSNGHPEFVESRSVLKMLHSFYEECFADIMSVLILGTSLEDYIGCIVNEAVEQGMNPEEFEKTDAMFRIGAVRLCLYDLAKELEEPKELKEWKAEFGDNSSEQWIKIANNAIKTCYSEESPCESDFEKDVYAFVANKVTFDSLYIYLHQCVESFRKYEKDPDMNSKIKNIQKTYQAFAGEYPFNAEEQIKEISRVIEGYKEYFWNNL